MSIDDCPILLNVTPTTNGIWVRLPNGDRIQASHTATLDIPSIPEAARQAHVFPDLTSGSLISVSLLCDHGCKATFDAEKVEISLNGSVVLRGKRETHNKLWKVDLGKPNHPPQNPNNDSDIANVIHIASQDELATFYHNTMGAPALSTLLPAIGKGYLQSFTGLTQQLIQKYRPNPVATSKGHLDQSRKNLRSTKRKNRQPPVAPPSPQDESEVDEFPAQDTVSEEVYIAVEPMGKAAMDSTARLPVRSKRGNEYCLVMYSYGGNYIHIEPYSGKTGLAITKACNEGTDFLQKRDVPPKFMILDNEFSKLL